MALTESPQRQHALRVLVLSADFGQGQVAAARALSEGLRALGTVDVVACDGLSAFGAVTRHMIRDGYRRPAAATRTARARCRPATGSGAPGADERRRRLRSAGTSRASIACSVTPRLYIVEAAHAASAPSTTGDMGPRHDRAALAIGALGVAAVHAAPALSARSAAVRDVLGVCDRTFDAATVALTFDDGPHPRGTPATLQALADAGVRATFFLAGEQVDAAPRSPRRS